MTPNNVSVFLLTSLVRLAGGVIYTMYCAGLYGTASPTSGQSQRLSHHQSAGFMLKYGTVQSNRGYDLLLRQPDNVSQKLGSRDLSTISSIVTKAC